jgi:TonB family protein
MRIHLFLILIVASGLANRSFAAGTVSAPPPDVTRLLIHAPTPELPVNPARFRSAHTGIYLLRVQIRSGAVTQVLIGQSAGDTALDRPAVKALLTWRFKPGAVPYRKITSVPMSPPQTKQETLVKVPVTFTF